MVRWVVEMYIEVASDYEFMGRGSGNREEGVKFMRYCDNKICPDEQTNAADRQVTKA